MGRSIQDLTPDERTECVTNMLDELKEIVARTQGRGDWRTTCEAVAQKFGVPFDQVQYAVVVGEREGVLRVAEFGRELQLAS